jgi:hypothetical protein
VTGWRANPGDQSKSTEVWPCDQSFGSAFGDLLIAKGPFKIPRKSGESADLPFQGPLLLDYGEYVFHRTKG